MKIIIKHFPTYGKPWPSPETEEIRKEAKAYYESLLKECGPNDKLRLVISNHWATQGYWVELNNDTPVVFPDVISCKNYQ